MGSRFSGWTLAAVEKVTGEKLRHDISQKPIVRSSGNYSKVIPDHVGQISAALNILRIKHELEYKFLHDRRFRFDIALPDVKLAIEFEGGIFTGGRHTRGKGYANDAKKYNLATMHGWKLLRYTSEITTRSNWEYQIADEIKTFANSLLYKKV